MPGSLRRDALGVTHCDRERATPARGTLSDTHTHTHTTQ